MIDAREWEEANSRYLSAALNWLRVSLEQRIESMEGAEANPPPPESPPRDGSSRAAAAPGDNRVAQAAEEMAEAESNMDAAPALVLLAKGFGLSRFEQNLLLLCAAAEFDSGFSTLCARAQGDPNRTYATFALALSTFDLPVWDALSPERALRFWRLIEINQPGAQALSTSALRADERIVNYIKGLNYLDDRLAPYLTVVESGEPGENLSPSQQALSEEIPMHWRQSRTESLIPVVQLLGADSTSKQVVASHAAAKVGRKLYRLTPETIPTQTADIEVLARLWQRESMLLPVALYVDAHELEPSDAHTGAVRHFLARSDGFFLLGVRGPWPRLPRESCVLDVGKPTIEEQRQTWESVTDGDDPPCAAELASQFNLNLCEIRRIASSVKSRAAENSRTVAEELWDACRARVRPMLDTLAHRLDAKASWDDIVLPREESDLLRQIASQVKQRSKVYEQWGFARKMNRGLGISALFAGESGTGKTMAAEVIANDLRLNLYRIDLSAVVSKYIGETEKNLRRLFDVAEDGGAILFFDEADALFGKRSEVKDSHDRYANIEINYLLQRMEAYRGLAILATNMRGAMDTAFTRRLRFIVNFSFPGVADRKRMWQKAFPAQTPTRRLDYDRLARLNLTGGSIHNAALNAAFLGAQAETPVTMALALAAARAEFVKLDRPINEADFAWLESTGVGA
jgi:hypothetical protein